MTAARSKITADLHRRVWPDRPGPLRAEAEFPNYTPAERRVDAIVHMIVPHRGIKPSPSGEGQDK